MGCSKRGGRFHNGEVGKLLRVGGEVLLREGDAMEGGGVKDWLTNEDFGKI